MKHATRILSLILAVVFLCISLGSCLRDSSKQIESIKDYGFYKIYSNKTDDIYRSCRGDDFVYPQLLVMGSYPRSLKDQRVTLSATPDERGRYTGSDGELYVKATATTDRNGFCKGDTYFFKIEPLAWYIRMNEKGKMLLTCANNVIVPSFEYETDEERESYVSKWLNEVFFNETFSSLEQSIILTAKDGGFEKYGDSRVFAMTSDELNALPRDIANQGYKSQSLNNTTAVSTTMKDYCVAIGNVETRVNLVISSGRKN